MLARAQTHTRRRYLSMEASVLTAALSGSTSPRLLHLHFLWILQLQGLQLLNNTRATEKQQSHIVKIPRVVWRESILSEYVW